MFYLIVRLPPTPVLSRLPDLEQALRARMKKYKSWAGLGLCPQQEEQTAGAGVGRPDTLPRVSHRPVVLQERTQILLTPADGRRQLV